MSLEIRAELRDEYRAWLDEPFPEAGSDIEEYPEFNVYLAGYVTRAISGQRIDLAEVPRITPEMERAVVQRIEAGEDVETDALTVNHRRLHRFIRLLVEYVGTAAPPHDRTLPE